MLENQIICDDSIDGLKKIDSGSVSVICTSPPFNVDASKWSYSSSRDNLPYQEYLDWLKNVFTEGHRVLRSGGRCIVNIDAMTNRQDDKENEYLRPIYIDLGNIMKDVGFKFYGEHIWYKSSLCPCTNSGQFNGKKTAWGSYKSCSTPAVRRNHEYILVYSKDQFKLEKDSNSKDSDITDKEFQTFIASVWAIGAETRNLGNHPVPYPEDLVYRCLKLYSYPGDLVLDPFNGSGTTTSVAYKIKRRYIGIDKDETYCKYAKERIEKEESYNLFD